VTADLVVRVFAEQARIVADEMSCLGLVEEQYEKQELLQRELGQRTLVA